MIFQKIIRLFEISHLGVVCIGVNYREGDGLPRSVAWDQYVIGYAKVVRLMADKTKDRN